MLSLSLFNEKKAGCWFNIEAFSRRTTRVAPRSTEANLLHAVTGAVEIAHQHDRSSLTAYPWSQSCHLRLSMAKHAKQINHINVMQVFGWQRIFTPHFKNHCHVVSFLQSASQRWLVDIWSLYPWTSSQRKCFQKDSSLKSHALANLSFASSHPWSNPTLATMWHPHVGAGTICKMSCATSQDQWLINQNHTA